MRIHFQGLRSLVGVDTHSLAHAYQTIYGSRPWSEFKKCQKCEAFWGVEDKHELQLTDNKHCDLDIVDYWSIEYLLDNFSKISSRPMFSAAIAFDEKEIVGFAWAYQLPLESFDEELNAPGLMEILANKFGADKKFCYLADLAVKTDYRGKGIARELTKIRHQFLKDQGIDILTTRTKGGNDPSITHLWYDKIGFNPIYHYNDERSRVVRAIHSENLNW